MSTVTDIPVPHPLVSILRYLKVSSSESGSANVANVSKRVSILGGVFQQPNDSNVDEKAWNLYDSQVPLVMDMKNMLVRLGVI